MTIAKKKVSLDTDEPTFDLSTMKRGRSRFAGKRLEVPLAELRVARNLTQTEVSSASGIPQGEVSKIENREDLDVISIATLRKYIAALGGELEIVARFPNGARVIARRGR